MDIRDNVKSAENKVSQEAERSNLFVRSPSNSLADRLGTFEDIMNIGDTSSNRTQRYSLKILNQ